MTFSTAIGSVLERSFATLGRIRPAAKPLHPRGMVLPATVERHGSPEPFGVPWLDEAGSEQALVRFSRSVGLPSALPDVLGLALRIDVDGAPADLLFATTGRGVPGRFVLRPRIASTVSETTYSTLQPYRGPQGPIVISATPRRDGARIVIPLAAARASGAWHEFGTVIVDHAATRRSDEPISFDAMLNELPGLPNYRWVRQVREGSYRAARRTRDRSSV